MGQNKVITGDLDSSLASLAQNLSINRPGAPLQKYVRTELYAHSVFVVYKKCEKVSALSLYQHSLKFFSECMHTECSEMKIGLEGGV